MCVSTVKHCSKVWGHIRILRIISELFPKKRFLNGSVKLSM